MNLPVSPSTPATQVRERERETHLFPRDPPSPSAAFPSYSSLAPRVFTSLYGNIGHVTTTSRISCDLRIRRSIERERERDDKGDPSVQ